MGTRVKAESTSPIALLFVWLGLVWLTFELFLVYDWGRGPERVALLAVLAVLLWLCRRWAPHFAAITSPSGAATRAAMVMLGIGLLLNVGPGLFYLIRSHQTHMVKSDQARTVLDALHVLEHGANPYATDTVTDEMAYGLAVDALAAQPACREPGGAIQFRVGTADESVVPRIPATRQCGAIGRLFSSLGFKYGPVTLFFYWPFVTLFGTAGFLASHLLLVLACTALLYRWARETVPSPFWAAIAILPFLWPTELAWNVLGLEHLDFLPVFLVTLAWLCWNRSRFVASAVCLGLSLAAKFLPALLFLPLLLKAPRRVWPVPIVIAAACFAPFAAWNWTGLWYNIGYPFTRPPDSTALAFFLAPWASALLRALTVLATAAFAVRAHLRGWDARTSLEYLMFAHLAVLASGTTLHNNYLVWLLPLLSLFLVEQVVGGRAPGRRLAD
jgi:hypothetical protein